MTTKPFEILDNATWADRGCAVASRCTACPLERCIEDMTDAVQIPLSRQRKLADAIRNAKVVAP